MPQYDRGSSREDVGIVGKERRIMSRQTAVRAKEEAESLSKGSEVKEAENGKARGEHL